MSDDVSLISVRHVTKSFAGAADKAIPVLEGIDLEVADSEFVALLGRSGSGKSTLLRCIAGLIAPTSGEVLFRGRRYDTGNKLDYLRTLVMFASERPDLAQEFVPWLRKHLDSLP